MWKSDAKPMRQPANKAAAGTYWCQSSARSAATASATIRLRDATAACIGRKYSIEGLRFGSRNGRPFRFERSFVGSHKRGEPAEHRSDARRKAHDDADGNRPFPMQVMRGRQTQQH